MRAGLQYQFAAFVVLCVLSANAADEEKWDLLKGEHFLVYYSQDKEFAAKTLQNAEDHYRQIARDIGYPRHDKFWLWENRVKIHIYVNRKAFARATGAPSWAVGKASHDKRQIDGFLGEAGFLDSVLPHEIAHLIFRDFVGFKGDVPLWLNEGIAMWAEKGRKKQARAIAKDLASKNKLTSLGKLTAMDVRKSEDHDLVREFYAQSISLVGYLIEEHGSSRFAKFCRGLRDGRSLDAALKNAYANAIPDLQKLETAWRKYLVSGERE